MACVGFALASFLLAVTGSPAWATSTWKSIGLQGETVKVIALDPTTPTTVYAGTDGGVFVLRPTKVGVFRPSDGNWYIRNSQTGTVTVQQWGAPTDKPVVGRW